jgi:hypothetical protein
VHASFLVGADGATQVIPVFRSRSVTLARSIWIMSSWPISEL